MKGKFVILEKLSGERYRPDMLTAVQQKARILWNRRKKENKN